MGGFQKMALVCPGGVNPNDKTVMINPLGCTWRGVNENLSPGPVHGVGLAQQETMGTDPCPYLGPM